jgi:Spy/CpxP family protein refolding chaperone
MNIQRTLIAAALAVVAASASAQGFPGGGPGGPGGPGGRGGMMRPGFGGPQRGLTPAGMLVMREDVQEDLKLTDAQRAKLDELRPQGRRGPGGGPPGPPRGGQGSPGGDPGEMREAFEAIRKKNEEAVLQILTPEQRVRIKEISLQLAGNSAIQDADVQTALGLTSDQKAKVKNLVEKQGEANRAVFERAREGGMERDAVMTIVKRNDEALKTELGKILTSDQASRLKTMAGKPFEAREPGRG